MKYLTATELNDFLFNEKNGFLTKFHFGSGLDFAVLDELYEILEGYKHNWKDKDVVPKDVVFVLITISSSLYMDLSNYIDSEYYDEYSNLLYNLDTAISMCLNPDSNDEHFTLPLKELGGL